MPLELNNNFYGICIHAKHVFNHPNSQCNEENYEMPILQRQKVRGLSMVRF